MANASDFYILCWLFAAGAFYLLLFAPSDIRKDIFRRQSPKDRYWPDALAIAVAVNIFVDSYFGWNYLKGAAALACGAVWVRGCYMVWRRARRSRLIDGAAAEGQGSPGAEVKERTREMSGESVLAEASPGEQDQLGSPAASRLRILHLLGLAACVAIYLGLQRAFQRLLGSGPPAAPTSLGDLLVLILPGSMLIVGAATALGGLAILAARRWRGVPFPVYPGEYLWIVTGASLALVDANAWLGWLILPSLPESAAWLLSMGASGLRGAIWLWALVNIGEKRWRAFLGAVVVANLVQEALYRTFGMSPVRGVADLIEHLPNFVDLVALVLVYLDHREGLRRPWTHWIGILMRPWFAAGWVIYSVIAGLL